MTGPHGGLAHAKLKSQRRGNMWVGACACGWTSSPGAASRAGMDVWAHIRDDPDYVAVDPANLTDLKYADGRYRRVNRDDPLLCVKCGHPVSTKRGKHRSRELTADGRTQHVDCPHASA